MDKVIFLPSHSLPVLHNQAATMSFENCYKLGKIYKEVIGLRNIHHFSINVVDKEGKMSILSYNPQIAYNIFKDGTYRYNGSISPDYYNKKDFYTWDETYDRRFRETLKNNMERKNGINKGFVLIKRTSDLTLLYSFATKKNGDDFTSDIIHDKNYFYSIGNHCFDQIAPIIRRYIITDREERKTPREHKTNIIRLFHDE